MLTPATNSNRFSDANHSPVSVGRWSWLAGVAVFTMLGPISLTLSGSETTEPVVQGLFAASGESMGTRFVIRGYADSEVIFREAAEAAFQRVDELNQCFSDYLRSSECCRLTSEGSHAYQKPVRVSRDLYRVLIFAKQLHAQSDGAVDVTIGPITRLWRRARRRKELPTDEQLASASQLVGFDAVELNSPNEHGTQQDESTTVRLLRKGIRFDFGAVAKGYAADEALRQMEAAGVTACLVDAGGDLAIGAPPPQKEGWTVRVAPLGDERHEVACLLLSDCGVATSGPTARGFRIGDQDYSHIADPQNGRVLIDSISVTTIAPSCMEADGLATAISLLGTVRGCALIDANELVECCCVSDQGESERPKVQKSAGFDNLRTCQRATKPKNDESRIVRESEKADAEMAN